MIDATVETLIPILHLLKLIPISLPTLRRWAKSGKLETVRAGRRIFTSRETVQRLLQHGPQQAHAAPPPLTRKQTKRSEHLKLVDEEWEALTTRKAA